MDSVGSVRGGPKERDDKGESIPANRMTLLIFHEPSFLCSGPAASIQTEQESAYHSTWANRRSPGTTNVQNVGQDFMVVGEWIECEFMENPRSLTGHGCDVATLYVHKENLTFSGLGSRVSPN